MELPFEMQGAGMFFALLDSTPAQVNTWDRLNQMQPFIDQALVEHNRLMTFAENTAANPRTAEMAAEMAECWHDLGVSLAAKQAELRRVLMRDGVAR